MTLFIQLAEHRDTQAVHAKMDELLRAVVDADNETAKIDKKKPKEIEAQRQQNSNENEPSQGTHYIPGRIPPCPELSLSLVRS
ncbi:low affinity iron permease family protein [Mesorhizobium sp. M0833]